MDGALRQRMKAARKPERTLHFPNVRGKALYEQRAEMLDRLRAIYAQVSPGDSLKPIDQRHDTYVFEWARSAGGNRLVTAQDFIGVLLDGATWRYFLLFIDGSSLHTWLGEDYGHKEIEVDLVGDPALDKAVQVCFARGLPRR